MLSGRFFVNFPQLLLDFGGKGVEQVLLHDQARPLQLPALAQLHRQAFQAVSSQLQLRQPRQLPKAGRQRLQAIVSQVQSAELLALEQLVWQALNLFVAGKRMETNIKAFILRCFKKQFSSIESIMRLTHPVGCHCEVMKILQKAYICGYKR